MVKKNKIGKIAMALAFSVLAASIGFLGAVTSFGLAQVGQMNIYAMDTGINISNTTSQMTTLFITLIGVMIPLIIIMFYFGIFQDFLSGMMKGFGGMFRRKE